MKIGALKAINPNPQWLLTHSINSSLQYHYIVIFITERIRKGGNAIAFVCSFVSSLSSKPTDALTLNFCTWIDRDHNLHRIEGHGHKSRSRSGVRLIRPRSQFFSSFMQAWMAVMPQRCHGNGNRKIDNPQAEACMQQNNDYSSQPIIPARRCVARLKMRHHFLQHFVNK